MKNKGGPFCHHLYGRIFLRFGNPTIWGGIMISLAWSQFVLHKKRVCLCIATLSLLWRFGDAAFKWWSLKWLDSCGHRGIYKLISSPTLINPPAPWYRGDIATELTSWATSVYVCVCETIKVCRTDSTRLPAGYHPNRIPALFFQDTSPLS